MIRTVIRRSRPIVILVAVFALGRVSARIDPISWLFPGPADLRVFPDGDVKPDRARILADEDSAFARVVRCWNAYIIIHDGVIPDDPYRALVDMGAVADYEQLKSYSFVGNAPPLICRELTRNPKFTIFSRNGPLNQQWLCFADGTWARVALDGAAPPGSDLDADRLLRHAGYPLSTWFGLGSGMWRARSQWVAQNRDKLVWDPSLQMYVVGSKGSEKSTGHEEGPTKPGRLGCQ